MREDHKGRARTETLHVVFEPFELLVSELTQTAGLEVEDVDQANEMDAILVEAVPTRTFGFNALQIAFTVEFATVVKYIVLPRNIEDVLGSAAL